MLFLFFFLIGLGGRLRHLPALQLRDGPAPLPLREPPALRVELPGVRPVDRLPSVAHAHDRTSPVVQEPV